MIIEKQLDDFYDELIDNVINTSDKEILKEVEEDYGDSSFVADRMRAMVKAAQRFYGKSEVKK